MTFLKSAITITSFSKILFAILFITLPFLGFFLGMNYQSSINESSQMPPVPLPKSSLTKKATPTIAIDETANWKTYKGKGYEFKYPQLYSLNEYPDKIEIYSPLSTCNPKLLFNIEEYGEMYEVKMIVKQRLGKLEDILSQEGGKEYGWEETIFNGKPGYLIFAGAEMIAPMDRYLVKISTDKVLDIQTYVFGSNDMGKCNPKLEVGNAMRSRNQILSTFKFTN